MVHPHPFVNSQNSNYIKYNDNIKRWVKTQFYKIKL